MVYRESDAEAPGDEVVVADVDGVELGMAVCYDLRFPELFRIMAVRGARVVSLPAAFTVPTGQAHWEILVRARAIENQVFMIAAGQIGNHPPDHESYGHSMIVDPWGVVLAEAPDEVGFIAADLDLDAQRERAREAALAREPAAAGVPVARAAGGALVSARRDGAADKRRVILDAAITRVRARGLPSLPRVGHRARGERRLRPRLPLLPLQGRGARHALHRALEPAARGDLRGGPQRRARARPAARDRRLHHRVLPQRPGPDEGDHRRGDPGREHLRPRASRRDPPGLRRDQRRSSPTARRRARSAPTSRPTSRPSASTARSSSC